MLLLKVLVSGLHACIFGREGTDRTDLALVDWVTDVENKGTRRFLP
jgi:hypothetical protein